MIVNVHVCMEVLCAYKCVCLGMYVCAWEHVCVHTQLKIQVSLLSLQSFTTKNLPLPRSLTHAINSRLTHILYIACVIYWIRTME